MYNDQDSLEQFLSLSVHLAGFDRAELEGTGLVQEYYQQVVGVIGETNANELWGIARNLSGYTGDELDIAIRRNLLSNPKFGPIARNIIQLWYWGSWIELPDTWRHQYGTNPQQYQTRFTSPTAYQEGLIWKAMHTHPQGAKQPGFGSWSRPPLDV
jgi:hypothetical protein